MTIFNLHNRVAFITGGNGRNSVQAGFGNQVAIAGNAMMINRRTKLTAMPERYVTSLRVALGNIVIAIFQVSTCCGSLFCRKLKGKRKAICFSASASFVTAGITGAIVIVALDRF